MYNKENIENIYPLTSFQEGLLFHELLEKNTRKDEPHAYFQQMTFKINGPLDKELFDKSWQLLIDRHDIFRTSFPRSTKDRPLQIVFKKLIISVEHSQLIIEDKNIQRAEINTLCSKLREKPLDLERPPLMRINCIQLDNTNTEFYIIWDFHHILMDGSCIGLVQNELSSIYNKLREKRIFHIKPPVQFGDFIKYSSNKNNNSQIKFWLKYLDGYTSSISLPGQRQNMQMGARQPCCQSLRLDSQLTHRLHALASEMHCTLSDLTQTIWGIFLGKQNLCQDVVFGSITSTRNPELIGIETMVGPCINMLPLRVRYTAGESLRSMLKTISKSRIDWNENINCAISDINNAAKLSRNFISHFFVFENYPLEDKFKTESQGFAPEITVSNVNIFMVSNYDFFVRATPGTELLFEFEFDGRKFDESSIEALSLRFLNMIERLVNQPDFPIDQLSLATQEETAFVISQLSQGPTRHVLGSSVRSIRESLLVHFPNALAVRLGDGRSFTHAELQQNAVRIALYLHFELNLKSGDVVAIWANPDEHMVFSVLACLMVGITFLPIEPSTPVKRVEQVLMDSEAKVMLASSNHSPNGILCLRTILVDSIVHRTHLSDASDWALVPEQDVSASAYLIYTSGTTGVPKGVEVNVSSLLNYLGWLHRDIKIDETSSTALLTSAAYDLGYTSLFGALILGGCISLFDEQSRRNPEYVLKRLANESVSFLKLTPSYLSMLLESDGTSQFSNIKSLKLMILGGEPQNFHELQKLKNQLPNLVVFNHYGPTEATIGCVAGSLEDIIFSDNPYQRIGRPIAGAKIFICDDHFKPLPPGVPGELMIGGLTLAKGYRKALAETSRSFIELDWLPGERLYRSGDVAQWNKNGDIHFLGRKDNQVKIMGYRVSLDWIELNIRQLDIVQDVCVCFEKNTQKNSELVAYFTLDPKGIQITQSFLRHALKKELPIALIPNRFIHVVELPLTANGKVDRIALAQFDSVQKEHKFSKPENESESNILDIWKETLHLDKIGMDDNFFELGGHSIKAILLVSKLRKLLGREVALQLIFEFPTPRSLTQALNQEPTERHLPSDVLQFRHDESASERVTFIMPTVVGTSMSFSPLTRVLKGHHWCFGLQSPGFIEGTTKVASLKALSLHFCKSIIHCSNGKPVNLVGWSFGAHLAYETAKHLESSGIETRVILIDAAVDGIKRSRFLQEENHNNSSEVFIDMQDLTLINTLSKQDSDRIVALTEHHYRLFTHHTTTGTIKSDLIVIEAMQGDGQADMKTFENFTSGDFRYYSTPGNHFSIFEGENLLILGDILSSELH